MATLKDVLQAVVDLDVKVKVVQDPLASMSVTKDGTITMGQLFMEKMTPTELSFAIHHEYAHVKLDHFHRMANGEQQLHLEYEADKYAADMLRKQGQQTCNQLDNIESLRPFWDTSHPSRSSLRGISCDANDTNAFAGGDSKPGG